jgi:hypothetical protein
MASQDEQKFLWWIETEFPRAGNSSRRPPQISREGGTSQSQFVGIDIE